MIVTKYEMRFTKLSCYVALLIPTKKEMVWRFIEDLSYILRYGMAREVETRTTFHQVVGIASLYHGDKASQYCRIWCAYSGDKGHHGRGYISRPI